MTRKKKTARTTDEENGISAKKGRRLELTEARLDYLERMGIFFERSGLPRMAGRIFGLLLTDTREVVSTSEILDLLHASRGSVSTMTRFLMERGIIEKTGKRGERQDYFRVKYDALNSMFSKRLEMIQDFKLIVRDGINFTEPESNSRRMVQELLEFYEWFERRLPSLWKEWEEQRKNRWLHNVKSLHGARKKTKGFETI